MPPPRRQSLAGKLEAAPRQQAQDAVKAFAAALTDASTAAGWAAATAPAIAKLRQVLAAAGIALPEREERLLDELDGLAAAIAADEPAAQKARNWVAGRLPVFVYVEGVFRATRPPEHRRVPAPQGAQSAHASRREL